MTYETLDNLLTLIITGIIYGSGLWFIAAFTIFVVNHDSSEPNNQLVTTVSVEPAVPIHPETLVRSLSPKVEEEQPINTVAQSTPIVAEPVDFRLWKLADLRCPRLRESLDIPLRPIGESRAYRKAELEDLYRKAIAQ